MRHLFPFVLCALLGVVVPAAADVIDTAPGGFTLKIAVDVASPPADVYRALVERVGTWWSADHTWSGNNANLSIDARPGGCWCEKLANGGGVQHMTVAYVDPGKVLDAGVHRVDWPQRHRDTEKIGSLCLCVLRG